MTNSTRKTRPTTTVVATDTEGNAAVFTYRGEKEREEATYFAAQWLLKRDQADAGDAATLTLEDIMDHYDFFVTLKPTVRM